MAKTTAPAISKKLIEYLDEVFPERCPDLDMTLDEIRFTSGQRAVVNFLIELYKEQQDNVLGS